MLARLRPTRIARQDVMEIYRPAEMQVDIQGTRTPRFITGMRLNRMRNGGRIFTGNSFVGLIRCTRFTLLPLLFCLSRLEICSKGNATRDMTFLYLDSLDLVFQIFSERPLKSALSLIECGCSCLRTYWGS